MNFRELFNRARVESVERKRCLERLAELHEQAVNIRAAGFDPRVRGGVHDSTAAIDSYIDKEAELRRKRVDDSEAWLDAAWDAIGLVSADYSDAAAQVLSMHWLFGDTWRDCARSLDKRSRTTPWDMANGAIDWLDSYAVVELDKEGSPHVRVL